MKKYSGYIILIPLAVGLLTIIGWAFSIDALKRPLYSHIAMNPLNAICFILCSAAFFLDFKRKFSSKISVISALLSVSVVTLGLVRLLSVIGLDLHPDSWLFHDSMIAATNHGIMSRMMPNSALGFVLIGSALRFGIVSTGRSKMICNYMALGTFCIGLFAFMGYIYHIRHYHDILNYLPMAFLTAICFMCLAISFLIENTDNVFVSRTLASFDKLSKA
jgi:hypothetical protein